jgi:hypothetical protein
MRCDVCQQKYIPKLNFNTGTCPDCMQVEGGSLCLDAAADNSFVGDASFFPPPSHCSVMGKTNLLVDNSTDRTFSWDRFFNPPTLPHFKEPITRTCGFCNAQQLFAEKLGSANCCKCKTLIPSLGSLSSLYAQIGPAPHREHLFSEFQKGSFLSSARPPMPPTKF